MPIQQLAPDVAAKIAAGEVVERPASVVKELVENALDAGARQITVELVHGGLELIRVTDDGCGMPASDMPLAFARHATSKIAHLADLEQVTTLGFRGEALASIGAVAEVTLLSRRESEERGAQMSIRNGEPGTPSLAAANQGTSVTVRNLFASVPARLKFVKSRGAEAGRAVQVVEQYALAFPEVRFVVESEGRQVFTTPGDGALGNVLVAVYGLRIAEEMVPLATIAVDDADSHLAVTNEPYRDRSTPPARVAVSGYVSQPSCYRSNRQYMSLFVNHRWVQSRALTYAIEEAYHSLLLRGRHPIAVIHLEIAPSLLDVNVHPAKTEVRFLQERRVYASVHRAVRGAILAAAGPPEVPSEAFDIPHMMDPTRTGSTGSSTQGPVDSADGPGSHQMEQLTLGVGSSGFATRAATAGDGGGEVVGGMKLPVLRVLGQISESYIITEGPDGGMYLVDQHAAHERILLERMVAGWRAESVSSQLLLQPVPVELSAGEHELVLDHFELLRAIGFQVDEFGDSTVLVRALPAALAASMASRPQSIRELLVELVGADETAASHGETWEEHALANVACKAAIKAGQSLSPPEQRELIRQLEETDARQSCCHGRPTMIHISLATLERQFDRR
ncbi:MAG: DNA mismatch repair protein MutL [Chloroflexi bacterium]|nr:MAG: DNA mismatch repair protein MutL [Chloroflexota bacterium]